MLARVVPDVTAVWSIVHLSVDLEPRSRPIVYLGRRPFPTIDPTTIQEAKIMGFVSAVGDWFLNIKHEMWLWFASLDPQEWFVLLGLTALFGFLCMRGFGSRSKA